MAVRRQTFHVDVWDANRVVAISVFDRSAAAASVGR